MNTRRVVTLLKTVKLYSNRSIVNYQIRNIISCSCIRKDKSICNNKTIISPIASFKTLSKNMSPNPIVTYEEIKELPKHPDRVLIDVRNPEELKESGAIPHAINIPLPELETAFSDSTNTETFKRKYGILKPEKDRFLIFSCAIGKRSQKAVDTVEKLGYTNARNYLGSVTDWAQREAEQT